MSSMNDLKQYIDQVYHEPYHLIWNHCLNKSWRIYKKAEELGIEARLIICIAKNPKWWWMFTVIIPHCYVLVNKEKVDVALSPEQEKQYWKNSDFKIYFPVKIASCTP